MRKEPRIDLYEDKLGTFLVKLSNKDITEQDSNEISQLLYSIGDLERIGDHAVNILKVSVEMYEKKIEFSKEAQEELQVITSALSEIMTLTMESFYVNDGEKAKKVEPLEQVIDILVTNAKNRHIERLQNGQCTLELGFILTELLNNIERASDHCSNIAVAIIQLHESNFNKHQYLNQLKAFEEKEFENNFESYKEKYIEHTIFKN